MENIVIIHSADGQVKNREKNLYKSYDYSLKNIANVIRETKADVYLYAGDIFEYANPNDSERKLINSHIGEILNIETLKEFVFMCGNHDLLMDKKQIDTNKENNAFDSLHKFIEALSPELANKVTYLKEQKQYISKVNPDLAWIAYSLENGMSNGNMLNWNLIDMSKANISIYHDILVDYVEDTKLPIRKDKLEKLCRVSDFKTNLVLAGDIHKNYSKSHFNPETQKTTKFIYPGSNVQRDFGEGSYIKIRKNSTVNHAEIKVVKKHNVSILPSINNVYNYTFETEDIELPSIINYITLDLNTNKVVDSFIESIENTLNQCIYGENQTFIKIKLSNSYINHEIEIIKLVEKISLTKQSVTEIHTVYDKFVLTSDGVNTNDINDIFVNEVTVIDADEYKELNIDDLKLDTDKLQKLFDRVLNRYVVDLTKEIGDDNLVNEILENIKSLFAEQIDLSLSSVPNYTVILNSIETNNFMNLGKNKIMLNIPGLTRIKGTNGIGKTTLYNMIRWVIDGIVFEGLKQNQKVKNTLLIFNDKQYSLDAVVSRLNCYINGTNVLITRSAFRKWKTNATDEIKKSSNWKDYISEVTTSLKITIPTSDGGQKDITGEEAEIVLKKWFGNITNTIMILNQQKILTMLNLPADKLQDLVLDYIGIDYLKVMKENLPSIKNQYNIQRPKTKIEDLRIDLSNANKTKNEGINLLQNLSDKFIKSSDDLKIVETQISDVNIKQINLGNIPELIININNEINNTEQFINNFEKQELKEIKLFDKIEPVEPLLSDELNKSITENKKIITDNELLINSSKNELIKKQQQFVTYINEQKNIDENVIINKWENFKIQFIETLENNETEFNNLFHNFSGTFKTTLNNLEERQQLYNDEINNIKNSTFLHEKRCNEITEEIKSGTCKTCLRPLILDETENLKFKNKLVSEMKEKQELIELNNKNLQILIEQTNKVNNFVLLYKEYFENSLSKNIQYFEKLNPDNSGLKLETINNISKINKNIIWYKQIIDNCNAKTILFFENYIQHLIENIETHTEEFKIINQFVEVIKTYTLNIKVYNHFIECIKLNQYELIKDLIEDSNKTPNINNIIEFYQAIIYLQKEITKFILDNDFKTKIIDNIVNEFNEIKNQYISEITEFNKLLTQHNKDNNLIIANNSVVHLHNDKLVIYQNKLKELLINKFDYELNLDDYNKLIEILNQLIIDKNLIQEKNNEISQEKFSLEKNLLTIDYQIDTLEKEYQNYIEYKKHSSIYGLYDKLINKDFPHIVFEYYRNFLNSTLNILLEDLNFKLYWHQSLDLYMIQIKNGQQTFRPVQLVSGMETSFLGLSLIYAIHTLNIKNSISNIFIDEISGQLNSGKELSESNAINYQEQLVLLLSKFNSKNIFIIDHVISNLFETHTYEVVLDENNTAIYKSV